MDQTTLITVHFPKDHERCFDYTSDPVIVSELLSIVQDSNVLELFESKLSIIRSEESFGELFRCHHSKEERDNKLKGLCFENIRSWCLLPGRTERVCCRKKTVLFQDTFRFQREIYDGSIIRKHV